MVTLGETWGQRGSVGLPSPSTNARARVRGKEKSGPNLPPLPRAVVPGGARTIAPARPLAPARAPSRPQRACSPAQPRTFSDLSAGFYPVGCTFYSADLRRTWGEREGTPAVEAPP